MVVAFIGIAGAGGLSNTLFSNYTRDKGWGMGALVGAIPSAVGGRTISLSHIGCAFIPQGSAQPHAMMHGWMRPTFDAINGSSSPPRFWAWPSPA